MAAPPGKRRLEPELAAPAPAPAPVKKPLLAPRAQRGKDAGNAAAAALKEALEELPDADPVVLNMGRGRGGRPAGSPSSAGSSNGMATDPVTVSPGGGASAPAPRSAAPAPRSAAPAPRSAAPAPAFAAPAPRSAAPGGAARLAEFISSNLGRAQAPLPALRVFLESRYRPEFVGRFLKWLLAIADSLHDFRRGYRNKKDPEGKTYATAFFASLLDRARATHMDYVEILEKGYAEIEHAIRDYFDTRANLEWVSVIDDAAKMSYDELLAQCADDDEAEALARQYRSQYDSFELNAGTIGVSDLDRNNGTSRVRAFLITFMFGSKDVPCYFTCDAAPKQVRKILAGSETARGLIIPMNIADSASTSFSNLTATENLYFFPLDIGGAVYTSDKNDMTAGACRIEYVPDGQFDDKTPFNWIYRIIAAGGRYDLRYGGANGNDGPSVDQLLEIQIMIHKYLTVGPSAGGLAELQRALRGEGRSGPILRLTPFTISKAVQMNLARFIGGNPGLLDFIIAQLRAGNSLTMDIKRGGDQDVTWGVTLARLILMYVAFVSGDPTACIASRAAGNPTIEHLNDRIRISKCAITETAPTAAQIAENTRNKLLRDLNRDLPLLYFFCIAAARGKIDEIATLLASLDPARYHPMLVEKIADINARLAPLRAASPPPELAGTSLDGVLRGGVFASYAANVAAIAAKKQEIDNPANSAILKRLYSELKALEKTNVYETIADIGQLQGLCAEQATVVDAIFRRLNPVQPPGTPRTAPYTRSFVNSIIRLSNDHRPTALSRQISELNFSLKHFADLKTEYDAIVTYGQSIAAASRAGGRPPAAMNIIEKTNGKKGYNKLLRQTCDGFFDQVRAPLLYSRFRIDFGTPSLNRATALYTSDAVDDEELETVEDVETFADPAYETAFKEFIRARRNPDKETAYYAALQPVLGLVQLPAMPPAVAVGGQRGGARQDELAEIITTFFAEIANDVNSEISRFSQDPANGVPQLYNSYRAYRLSYELSRAEAALSRAEASEETMEEEEYVGERAQIARDKEQAAATLAYIRAQTTSFLADKPGQTLEGLRDSCRGLDINTIPAAIALVSIPGVDGAAVTPELLLRSDYVQKLANRWEELTESFLVDLSTLADIELDTILYIENFIKGNNIPGDNNTQYAEYLYRLLMITFFYDLLQTNPGHYSYFTCVGIAPAREPLDLPTRIGSIIAGLDAFTQAVRTGGDNIARGFNVCKSLLYGPGHGGSRRTRSKRVHSNKGRKTRRA